jgi:hypothetical protein
MRKRIGRFELGCRSVDLYVDVDTDGGSFNLAPDTGIAEIVVGTSSDDWRRIVSNLAHESSEAAMSEMGLRYCQSPDYSRDNGGWLLVMTHTQFSEAMARASHFMADALPALQKAAHGRRK